MISDLAVLIDGTLVGSLWLDERKRFCFRYDEAWLGTSRIPLSLALPLRREAYLDDQAHPFFANLLPEEKIRVAIARNLGVSLNNDYGLLEKIGGDCAGAVSVYPTMEQTRKIPGDYQKLTQDELSAIIGELPKRPLLAGEKGIRLSLAGAQKKLPVHYDGHDFHLCHGSAASSYIIKPAIEGLDGTVENEAFCMTLARAVGLDVPRSFIHRHKETAVFVVKRYDRATNDNGISRLHQEDFCQALGIPPEFKYEIEGGPTLAACFNLVRKNSRTSGKDLLALVNWVIFNYLTGNSDAHAKNISLLLLPEGPRLAPFYDMISTRIYAHYGLTAGLAMKIGGEHDPDALQKRHWQQFAEEIGIKPSLVLKRIIELAGKLELAKMRLFKEEFAPYRCDALYRLMQLIGEQSEKAIKRVG